MHCWAIAAAVVLLYGSVVEATSPVVCRSPNGALAIEFSLRQDGTFEGVPHYRVRAGGADVIGWSRLGVDLAGGEFLGGPCGVTEGETRSLRDEYTQFPGKRREVGAPATAAAVRVREAGRPNRLWDVVLRAYDDGVAFRYRFPAQKGWTGLLVAGERTRFAFPDGTRAYALPLNGFTTSYEQRYQRRPVAELP